MLARAGAQKPHAALLHDPSGGRVAGEMRSGELVDIEKAERERDHRAGRRGGVAAAPIGTANPVTQIFPLRWRGAQAYAAYQERVRLDGVGVFLAKGPVAPLH